jgi:MHS family alpha-ketoglutarate permease-like MFS transporter
MASYGWRIPFIVGSVFGVIVLWIRQALAETDTFTSTARRGGPRARIWSEPWPHRRQTVQVVGMIVGFTVVYYAWVIAAPAYAVSTLHIDATAALCAGALAALLIATLPLWGAPSDRIGRRPVLLISALGTALLLFPLRAVIGHSAWQLGLAMAVANVFIAAGVAVLPAACAEMFPTGIRTVASRCRTRSPLPHSEGRRRTCRPG